MVVKHCFRQFCWDHLWRDTFWLCTLQSQLHNAGIVYGMVYKKTQHHGKQLPNQTYQVLTLFWGDQIHVHPKKRNEYICEHINYLIFQAEVINRQLIHRSLNTVETQSRFIICFWSLRNLTASPHIQLLYKAQSKQVMSIS